MMHESDQQPATSAQRPSASPGAAEVWAGRDSFFGAGSAHLDDWLAIAPDGTVTAFSGKVELGTGTRTALAQIVADELDVPMNSVRMVMGDTERTPNEGYTAGSMTIQMGGTALRRAAAEARQTLLELAAERLEVLVTDLIVRDGTIMVRGAPARRVTYAELIGGRRFDREMTGTAPLKRPADHTIVGTDVPRLDLPAKFTGQPAFVHDLRLPGMRHARIVRPPHGGVAAHSVDESTAGGARVVRLGSFIAVVAEREELAIRAARQLKVEWEEGASLLRMATLFDELRRQPTHDQVIAESGDVASELAGAAQRLHATYYQPFQAHATLGPSCAVADWRDGELTVWCSTQGVYPLRAALADVLAIAPEQIHVIHMEGAGAYGQSGADDAAAEAALLAKEIAAPVRVQWSREDEFAWEPKGPAMLVEMQGGVNEQGAIVAWDTHVWSPSHGNRPRSALDFLAGQLIRGEPPRPRQFYLGGERNAPNEYRLPSSRVTLHWLAQVPLRWSSLRSLGGAANTFANESFMDELATSAGADPVAFRLRYLSDDRAREVIQVAAERAGWGSALPAGAGRGIAFARYENQVAYVATVAEVQVDAQSGAVWVQRMCVAHDCGLIINPDGVRNQIEGNVIQSLSRALKEEVTFDTARVTSLDWQTYPILTFSEIPDLDIALVNRPDQPSVGAGEAATVTTAAAVANAIYAAVGARLRRIPFTPERVRAALGSR